MRILFSIFVDGRMNHLHSKLVIRLEKFYFKTARDIDNAAPALVTLGDATQISSVYIGEGGAITPVTMTQ